LAAKHAVIAGIVCVNPAVDPPAPSFIDMMRGILESGTAVMPAIGDDIADPDGSELAYDGMPIEPLLTMVDAERDLFENLGRINCPVLIMTSPQDHVVPPGSSDVLAEPVAGPVEPVTLARSYHGAKLDYAKHETEQRPVDLASQNTDG